VKRKLTYKGHVHLATHGVDMRKQINGLAAIVQGSFEADLYEGGLFVFCNNSRTIIKILYWDVDGFVLFQKRRERGRFYWPKFSDTTDDTVVISDSDMNRLLDGLVMEEFIPKTNYAVV
jgi:transposase